MKVTQIGFLILFLVLGSTNAMAQKIQSADQVKKSAETEIKGILDPLINRYCSEQCKLLGIESTVDVVIQDEVAPGFDELSEANKIELAPASSKVKLLIDEMIGPVSRQKFLDLIKEHLSGLKYPVELDVKTTHFPQSPAALQKAVELRTQLNTKIQSTISEFLTKFCPKQCYLVEFELRANQVNPEEAQYGSSGEYVQDAGVALWIKNVSGTVLMDETLTPEEQNSILETIRLKTKFLKNVQIEGKVVKFPEPLELDANGKVITARWLKDKNWKNGQSETSDSKMSSTDTKNSKSVSDQKNETSTTSKNDTLQKQEATTHSSTQSNNNNNQSTDSKSTQSLNRIEKIERVEQGDALKTELQEFKNTALYFAIGAIILLCLILVALYFKQNKASQEMNIIREKTIENFQNQMVQPPAQASVQEGGVSLQETLKLRYEIDGLMEELTKIYSEQPKVTKQVFSSILQEDGVEVTAAYMKIFGETIAVELIKDASLQHSVNDLLEYYAKTQIEIKDVDKLDLLKKLHNRTVSAKLVVQGNRTSGMFEFLIEMDAMQIVDLTRNESLTVKAIVLTQVDPNKRNKIYGLIDEGLRLKLLTELSRIDYLPKDYIHNVANALRRKKTENPKLNTEAVPGSDVLVGLLEKTNLNIQQTIIKNIEHANPESARQLKHKIVSVDTLRFLRDNQLLDVVLNLKHEELLIFLKACPESIRQTVFAKCPQDLVADLKDELATIETVDREAYQSIERKIVSRIRMLTHSGAINLSEINERMFAEADRSGIAYVEGTSPNIRRVA